jgi:hypothetical protein
MVFTDAGSSFTCTGTALNDADSSTFRPYFLSANHCISTQSVADTLNTFWNFESQSCNSDIQSSEVVQLTQGAQMLTTDFDTDTSLFILREQLPAGGWFAGWDVSFEPAAVFGIHHPSGDLKKLSFGDVISYSSRFQNDSLDSSNPDANFLRTQWSAGTTEGGSSGSAIFNQSSQVVGTLLGGAASCSAPDAPDWYGRFDRAYLSNGWGFYLNSDGSPEISIAEAVSDAPDQEQLSFTTSGPWFVTSDETATGDTSVSTGNLENNESATLQTVLVGPGQLSFFWKVSSEASFDFLTLSIDGQPVDSISGEVDWRFEGPIAIGPGSHTATWTYSKDFSVSSGEDRGWIDDVRFSLVDVDTDSDGVPDSLDAFPDDPEESIDADEDGLGANLEAQLGTSDDNSDSDGDGYPDRDEFESGSDPTDANDFPSLGLPVWLIYESSRRNPA